jgi:hypothetical protein
MIELKLEKIIGTGKTKVPVKRAGGTTMEYRRTGRKSSGRAGTGKIDKLPENIRDRIESMIDADDTMRQAMIDANVATLSDKGFKLSVTPQGLLDYAKKRGAIPQTKHSGPKSVAESQAQEKERHEETKKELARANEKNVRLEVDVKELKGHFEADRKEIRDSDKLRDDMRTELRACKAKLAKE